MSLFDSASLCVTPNGTKASKLYAIKPTDASGDLTVVRATTATRKNSAGLIESVATNVPRLDYTNGTCPSILVEPQRTNIYKYSEQFDNASWTKTNTTVNANQTTSPDGTTTADKLNDIISGSSTDYLLNVQNALSFTSGTTYTISFYAKNIDRRYMYIRFVPNAFGVNKYAYFDLQNGVISKLDSGATATITSVGNGWYRCTATYTATVTTTTLYGVYIGLSADGLNNTYVNASVKSVYIWGAQLEAGSYATSYIPTTSASVTRNADVISKTGISSLIGQTEGTILVDFVINAKSSNTNIINSERNTTASFSIGVLNDGRVDADLFASGSPVARITQGSLVEGTRYKVAYAYKSGGTYLYINGVLAGNSTQSFTLPSTLDDIYLNDVNNYFNNQNNVSFNLVSFWKTQLTTDELATLTTL